MAHCQPIYRSGPIAGLARDEDPGMGPAASGPSAKSSAVACPPAAAGGALDGQQRRHHARRRGNTKPQSVHFCFHDRAHHAEVPIRVREQQRPLHKGAIDLNVVLRHAGDGETFLEAPVHGAPVEREDVR